jgi:hypothetical protein
MSCVLTRTSNHSRLRPIECISCDKPRCPVAIEGRSATPATYGLGPGQDDIPVALEERVQTALAANIQVHVDTTVVMKNAAR